MQREYDILIGVDVGKHTHHMTALAKDGSKVLDKKVLNDEGALKEALSKASQGTNKCLVVTDQPGNLSSLLFGVAKKQSILCGFITPKAMAKAAELYGLSAKTDALDSFVIADIALRIPSLVISLKDKAALAEELSLLLRHDRNLTVDITRTINRLHEMIFSLHPAFEDCLSGLGLKNKVPLLLLERYGGPRGLKRSGKARVSRWITSQAGCGLCAERIVECVFSALEKQNLILEGSAYKEEAISSYAAQLIQMLTQRKIIERRRDEVMNAFSEDAILRSLPGIGSITSATFLSEVPQITVFSSAAHLASYAGFAPRIRRSGTTVSSSAKPTGGNRRLKRVLFISAERSVWFCDESRRYYDKKRREGKCHTAAVMALARQRCDVIYALLKAMEPYKKENGKLI